MNRQLKVLGLGKGSHCYKPKETSAADLELCAMTDREHAWHPARGVRQMRLFLLRSGIETGVKRVRRLMRAMSMEAHCPKPDLSKPGRAKYVHHPGDGNCGVSVYFGKGVDSGEPPSQNSRQRRTKSAQKIIIVKSQFAVPTEKRSASGNYYNTNTLPRYVMFHIQYKLNIQPKRK